MREYIIPSKLWDHPICHLFHLCLYNS